MSGPYYRHDSQAHSRRWEFRSPTDGIITLAVKDDQSSDILPALSRGATIYVAAKDSKFPKLADMTCDGINDEVEINNAIAMLPSSGGTVLLQEGTYVIDATNQATNGGVITIDKDNVALMGMGRGTVLDFIAGQNLADRYMIGIKGSADFQRLGWLVANLRVKAHDAAHHGIRVTGSDIGYIEQVWLEHDGSSTDEGIQFSDAGAGTRNVIIRRLYVSGFNTGLEYAAGDRSLYGCVLRDSVFQSCMVAVRTRTGGTQRPRDILIQGIHVLGGSDMGINIQNSLGIVLAHNLVRDITDTNGQGNGIHFASDTDHCLVVGCIVERCDKNGFLIDGTYHVIQSCIARNNGQDTGATTGQRAGFRINGVNAQNCLLVGNLAHDNQGTVTQQRGFLEGGAPTGNIYIGNVAHGNAQDWVMSTGYDKKRSRFNVGLVTENAGTATIPSGSTSVAVSHGLGVTPALADIQVTPTNNLGSASRFWVSNPTSSQFTINVDADPGVSTATFAWRIVSM